MSPSGASNNPQPSRDTKSSKGAPAQKNGREHDKSGQKPGKERAHRGVAAADGKATRIGRLEGNASTDASTPAGRINRQRGRTPRSIEHPMTGGAYKVDASLQAPESTGLGQRIRISLRGAAGALAGLPLLPVDDAYDAGMVMAAFLVLAADMLIDLGTVTVHAIRSFVRRFQLTEMVMQEANGDRVVRTEMTVRKRSVDAYKAGVILRVITLALLIAQEIDELADHHTALLAVAVGTVVLDVVIEISMTTIKRTKNFIKRFKSLTIARTDRDTESRN